MPKRIRFYDKSTNDSTENVYIPATSVMFGDGSLLSNKSFGDGSVSGNNQNYKNIFLTSTHKIWGKQINEFSCEYGTLEIPSSSPFEVLPGSYNDCQSVNYLFGNSTNVDKYSFKNKKPYAVLDMNKIYNVNLQIRYNHTAPRASEFKVGIFLAKKAKNKNVLVDIITSNSNGNNYINPDAARYNHTSLNTTTDPLAYIQGTYREDYWNDFDDSSYFIKYKDSSINLLQNIQLGDPTNTSDPIISAGYANTHICNVTACNKIIKTDSSNYIQSNKLSTITYAFNIYALGGSAYGASNAPSDTIEQLVLIPCIYYLKNDSPQRYGTFNILNSVYFSVYQCL